MINIEQKTKVFFRSTALGLNPGLTLAQFIFGLDFIRLFAEETYNIPPENVIGSSILKEFQITSQGAQFIRLPQLVLPINDKNGKPVNIERFIGKKPIIAVGNSDGDIEMMQYTVMDNNPSLALLLHHDDAEREYSYTQKTEKALQLAQKYNWKVISMKEDFKQVYPFELKFNNKK